jgi:hypothetical protein
VSEPALERLCDRWGFKDAQAAIEFAVRVTFPELRNAIPPIDLLGLAKRRNVLSIDAVALTADGIISSVEDGYRIQVNRAQSANRRRFTIAHELGHTFFLELEVERNLKRFRVIDENLQSLRSDGEERLCNSAAAEILMPPEPFGRYLYDYGSSVEGISTLSRIFQVSLWATARRVLGFRHGYPFLTALWQFYPQHGCYISSWTVRSERVSADRKLFLHNDCPAFKSFHNLSRFRKREWLSLGGALDNYVIDGMVVSHEPRRILTSIMFGKSDEWLSDNRIARADDQLPLPV